MTGPSPAKSGRPAIAIIRRGSFSSINDAFLAAFTKLLPGYDFEVVDVLELMENEGLVFKVRARLVALKEFTRLLLLRRERMSGAGGCMIRTTFYFEQLRRRLAERLSGRTYVFTLQTQSLFDGSLRGVPHFVYTDHAELQCLSLPGFSPKDLFPPRFIALETSIYKNAEMVFTMSDATRRCLVEEYGCPEEQVAWVRAGPNAPPNGEVPVPDRYESQRILFVAARWEPKGGPELAAAFERLLATHPRAELTIVGCSPHSTFRTAKWSARFPSGWSVRTTTGHRSSASPLAGRRTGSRSSRPSRTGCPWSRRGSGRSRSLSPRARPATWSRSATSTRSPHA